MARSKKQLDGLPLRKFKKLVRLLDKDRPSDSAARTLYFQAVRQAASNLQAAGNLGLLQELTLSQRARLKEANDAQRDNQDKAKAAQSSAVSV